MATISDLIGLLFRILNLHASTLVRHASQLRVAGFLPAEDENLAAVEAAVEAAVFLAAVTGSRAPTEAVEAARVFTSLPLIGVEDYHENPATGVVGGTRKGIAGQHPPSDEQDPLWASASRSFVAALEFSIHRAQAPDFKLEELPTAIGILRNLRFPVALIAIGRREVDGVWREGRLLFGPADAVDGASGVGFAGSQRMQVWAYLPAIVIPLLGDLLADRLDVPAARRTATPAEELQAGGSAGRVSQPANCLRVPSRPTAHSKSPNPQSPIRPSLKENRTTRVQ
jgi:hypothetical protein